MMLRDQAQSGIPVAEDKDASLPPSEPYGIGPAISAIEDQHAVVDLIIDQRIRLVVLAPGLNLRQTRGHRCPQLLILLIDVIIVEPVRQPVVIDAGVGEAE